MWHWQVEESWLDGWIDGGWQWQGTCYHITGRSSFCMLPVFFLKSQISLHLSLYSFSNIFNFVTSDTPWLLLLTRPIPSFLLNKLRVVQNTGMDSLDDFGVDLYAMPEPPVTSNIDLDENTRIAAMLNTTATEWQRYMFLIFSLCFERALLLFYLSFKGINCSGAISWNFLFDIVLMFDQANTRGTWWR